MTLLFDEKRIDGAMVSAAQIRAARAFLGWSREKLAAEAGVTEAEVAAVETASRSTARPAARRALSQWSGAGSY